METLQERSWGKTNKLRVWLVFFVASLFPFYAFIQMNFLNTLSASLIQNVGITPSQLGVLSAGYLFVDALFLLPVGILLDRFSIRILLLAGIFICTLGALFFSISQAFVSILSSRLISGIGHAFALLSCFRFISLYFE
jgi:predicted MFS family arabinose efflux permease